MGRQFDFPGVDGVNTCLHSHYTLHGLIKAVLCTVVRAWFRPFLKGFEGRTGLDSTLLLRTSAIFQQAPEDHGGPISAFCFPDQRQISLDILRKRLTKIATSGLIEPF